MNDNKRQRIELADIFTSHASDYLHNNSLCIEQRKAFDSIIRCRTASLGGHSDSCQNCGYSRQSYNSCRNRHCPKCQFIKQARWVDKLSFRLLPVKHYHVVFTIPRVLHKLFYLNQGKAYNLLFQASGKALMQCLSNPKFLGVQAGAVALLHTWGQTLVYHPHVHMIVPAGGLSEDQMEWIPSSRNFLIPVKALSIVFRGVLCRLLEQNIKNGAIKLPDEIKDFKSIKNQCYQKNWVVYCEKPFKESCRLIKYLGSYSHRVAISNSRLKAHENNKVRFCYKDYKAAGLTKQITLDSNEFIRRFLQHVLPKGFYKIRYFGFMAMCNTRTKLEECFNMVQNASYLPVYEGLDAMEVFHRITGIDPVLCPKCEIGRMVPEKQPNSRYLDPG
jgi:hypothetical protein